MKAQTVAAHALVFALLVLETVVAKTKAEEGGISPYRNLRLNNMYIQKLLCPSAFVGILIALSFFGLILVAMYMLMSIQAPIFFH